MTCGLVTWLGVPKLSYNCFLLKLLLLFCNLIFGAGTSLKASTKLPYKPFGIRRALEKTYVTSCNQGKKWGTASHPPDSGSDPH